MIKESNSRTPAVTHRPALRLWVPSAVILANYAAQVPYGLHLYGPRAITYGSALLLLTMVWFVAGFWLLIRAKAAGYWLTLSFLVTDFGFYLYNLIGGWVHGYGLFFHAWHLSDPILWAVFMIGYANFFAAGYLLMLLFRTRLAKRTMEAR
jgi:hypothetical protein